MSDKQMDCYYASGITPSEAERQAKAASSLAAPTGSEDAALNELGLAAIAYADAYRKDPRCNSFFDWSDACNRLEAAAVQYTKSLSPQNSDSASLRDPFDEDEDDGDPTLDPDWCDECQGRGKVTTADYESYFGANYKPCPKCGGDPCLGEPPCS